MPAPNPLMRVAGVATGVACCLLLFPLSAGRKQSQHPTSRPSAPQSVLAQLGGFSVVLDGYMDRPAMGAKPYDIGKHLVRMSYATRLFAVLVAMECLLNGYRRISTHALSNYVIAAVFTFGLGLSLPAVLLSFFPSMQMASALVRRSVNEVILAIEGTDPENSELWDQKVARPALALDKMMKNFSNGWGSGVIGGSLGVWMIAFAAICNAINTDRSTGIDQHKGSPPNTDKHLNLFVVALVAPLPIFIAFDVAHTTSRCASLIHALNSARMRHGEEYNLRISFLEAALGRLNKNQGLGQSPIHVAPV
eukprot:SAG31_NODE_5405_length_2556_cov_1.432234_2_plen_307_part_00